jgi:hypothetical protein
MSSQRQLVGRRASDNNSNFHGRRGSPQTDRATAIGRPAVFGTVGRTTDRAVLQKQLVPEVPRPSRLEPTMPGRRFGDLEQQLVDVQR